MSYLLLSNPLNLSALMSLCGSLVKTFIPVESLVKLSFVRLWCEQLQTAMRMNGVLHGHGLQTVRGGRSVALLNEESENCELY